MKQNTLKKEYKFVGTGLHTGKVVNMTILPAPENTGIVFHRADLGEVYIEANALNVSKTNRSTFLEKDGVQVGTTEHLLAAFIGVGVDNAIVRADAPELPILDGSAKLYTDAFLRDGLQTQDAERKYFSIKEPFHWEDDATGAVMDITPADDFQIRIDVDFNSKVMGLQSASYTPKSDFAKEIAPCRTFCFLHEIEPLLNAGLIQGGSLDNALVIVENKTEYKGKEVVPGYISNRPLMFPNECARHKLLDVMGDFALAGKPMKAHIYAKKPGHTINTRIIRYLLENNK